MESPHGSPQEGKEKVWVSTEFPAPVRLSQDSAVPGGRRG